VAIKDDKYTLSTTAEIISKGGSPGNKRTCMIRAASATIFVGGPGVTAGDGFPINVNETFSLELSSGDDLYAIASAGTPTINVIVTNSDARVGTGD
jgi:hypothetical protein